MNALDEAKLLEELRRPKNKLPKLSIYDAKKHSFADQIPAPGDYSYELSSIAKHSPAYSFDRNVLQRRLQVALE